MFARYFDYYPPNENWRKELTVQLVQNLNTVFVHLIMRKGLQGKHPSKNDIISTLEEWKKNVKSEINNQFSESIKKEVVPNKNKFEIRRSYVESTVDFIIETTLKDLGIGV